MSRNSGSFKNRPIFEDFPEDSQNKEIFIKDITTTVLGL